MFVFLISLIIFGMISYLIFWDQNRANPLFSHYSKRKNFEVTLFSVSLFWLISSLLLLILLTYKEKLFNILLGNCSQKKFIIESGLCFSISLVVVGLLIRLIYYLIFKAVDKYCKRKYIDSLNRKEQTWVFVLACILLASIGFKDKNYHFAYFVIALIIGKFFWLDNTITNFKEMIYEIKHLDIWVLLVLGWSIYYIFIALFNENNIWMGISGSAVGFILGLLLYAYKNRNK